MPLGTKVVCEKLLCDDLSLGLFSAVAPLQLNLPVWLLVLPSQCLSSAVVDSRLHLPVLHGIFPAFPAIVPDAASQIAWLCKLQTSPQESKGAKGDLVQEPRGERALLLRIGMDLLLPVGLDLLLRVGTAVLLPVEEAVLVDAQAE